MEVVEEIAALAPLTLKAIKETLTAQVKRGLEEGLKLETEKFVECYQTEDRVEGVTAFFEKRKPSFKGK